MKNEMINGMEPARFLAAQLLTNSSLTGKRYYDKEDEYTDTLRANLPLISKGAASELDSNEKYRTILCVKYARLELSAKLLQYEVDYDSIHKYDEQYDKLINRTKESIAFYDALIEKLEEIL